MVDQIQLQGTDGSLADVDGTRLLARPRSEWEDAVEAGDAYSWANATYNYTAADTVLAVQNDSPTRDLVITKIIATGDAATELVVHTSSSVAMAGTAVTGVNLNRSSSKVAPATAKADETGNGQAAASYSGKVLTGRFAANGQLEFNVDGAIVIPQGWNIGADYITVGAACNMVILGYFRDRPTA